MRIQPEPQPEPITVVNTADLFPQHVENVVFAERLSSPLYADMVKTKAVIHNLEISKDKKSVKKTEKTRSAKDDEFESANWSPREATEANELNNEAQEPREKELGSARLAGRSALGVGAADGLNVVMSNVENVCPQTLRGVARELRRLAANPPAGIKLLLRDDDLTDVVATMEGPAGTPYHGGTFRVRLVLGREFPAAPPRAFFLTKLFHPNVAPDSGEVCVNTLKRDWRPELGLEHALLAVKCLLIAPNAESALNAEAAALLRDRYDDYFARAKLLTDIHARAPAPLRRRSGGSAEPAGAPEPSGPAPKRERRAAAAAAPAKAARRVLKRL
ncbi:hypothetical protein PYW07_003547 [Mythimna separata]|uniref:E2 ubiquitin-conjugating enzyme n=1 Tax=Mythimna separata TaxID=271217 RepID=A0AAD8DT58_MYTSE|nr:hypothetical protein PYW07_003547 [Mythimna separata]